MARRLPPLPQIADLIRLYDLSAKSQLSQNFLLDLNITDKLVKVADHLSDCCVCEVGPGPGSLTRSILNAKARKVIAVEKDRRFLPSLELLSDASGGRLDVHLADALKFDMAKYCGPYITKREWYEEPPNFHIIGNLPFNVSIPLLLQWLSMIPQRQGPFSFGRSQLTLTFQKEVAERIVAGVSDSQRSRPSIMAQHLCDIKWGFVIGSKCFVPKPKVEAVVLKLTPLVKPRVEVDYHTFEKVVKNLFQFRRKFVKRGTMLLFPDCEKEEQKDLAGQLLEQSGVSYTLRAQDLTVEQFGAITNNYQRNFVSAATAAAQTPPSHAAAAAATPSHATAAANPSHAVEAENMHVG